MSAGAFTLLLDEDFAELIDVGGNVEWSSDDDDNFEYSADDADADEIVDYLVKAEVIDAENEVGEIVDERGEVEAVGDDDDDDDDETDDDDD